LSKPKIATLENSGSKLKKNILTSPFLGVGSEAEKPYQSSLDKYVTLLCWLSLHTFWSWISLSVYTPRLTPTSALINTARYTTSNSHIKPYAHSSRVYIPGEDSGTVNENSYNV